MKRGFRIFSIVLCISIITSLFSVNFAFADDKEGEYKDGDNTYYYEKIGSSKAAIVGFSLANNATSVTVPYRIGPLVVTQIGDGDTAIDLDNITSITLPKDTEKIAANAFENTALRTISMNADLTEIGDSAFEGCDALTSVSIPSKVKKIGRSAFEDATALTSVSLGSALESIGANAFDGCEKLSSVTLPSNLRSIGSEAFHECKKITKITIPASVTSIGSNAFEVDNDDNDDIVKSENMTLEISGYDNTAAEEYASKNKIYFKSLGKGSSTNRSMSLSSQSISVAAGSRSAVTVSPSTASPSAKSDNTAIATVSVSGTQVFISGVSMGSTIVTVSASGYRSQDISVTVTAPNGGSYPLSLDTPSYAFNAGDTYYVKAKTNAATPPSAVSNAPGIVSVTYAGQKPDGYIYQIKGVGAGGAVVTFVSGANTVTMPVSVSALGSGVVTSDTTVNFSKRRGQLYTFKMTVSNTYAKPSFTVGNGAVMKTYAQKRIGNVYYFQVIAIGKPGESTGVYTTLPGQQPVKHCTAFVAA